MSDEGDPKVFRASDRMDDTQFEAVDISGPAKEDAFVFTVTPGFRQAPAQSVSLDLQSARELVVWLAKRIYENDQQNVEVWQNAHRRAEFMAEVLYAFGVRITHDDEGVGTEWVPPEEEDG